MNSKRSGTFLCRLPRDAFKFPWYALKKQHSLLVLLSLLWNHYKQVTHTLLHYMYSLWILLLVVIKKQFLWWSEMPAENIILILTMQIIHLFKIAQSCKQGWFYFTWNFRLYRIHNYVISPYLSYRFNTLPGLNICIDPSKRYCMH